MTLQNGHARPRDAAADVERRGEKIIKGRKEVFSERLEGEQGLGGDMENKQTRQQTAGRGGGVTKLALFLFWLLH